MKYGKIIIFSILLSLYFFDTTVSTFPITIQYVGEEKVLPFSEILLYSLNVHKNDGRKRGALRKEIACGGSLQSLTTNFIIMLHRISQNTFHGDEPHQLW